MNTLKQLTLTLMLVFFSLGLKAQTLESVAQEISSIQHAYSPYTDALKTMAFRENSLQRQPNGTFHLVFYGEADGEMAQLSVKDLDFSSAVGLEREADQTVIIFPKKTVSLRVNLRDKDLEILLSRELTLSASQDNAQALFKAAYDLVTLAKIEKGLMTAREAKKDWKAYETMDPRIFVHEHKNSILAHWWFAEKALARSQETVEYLEGDLEMALQKEKVRFPDLQTRVGDCEATIRYSDGELQHYIILPYDEITVSDSGVLSYYEPKIKYYQKAKGSSEKYQFVENRSSLSPLRISAQAGSLVLEFSMLRSGCD